MKGVIEEKAAVTEVCKACTWSPWRVKGCYREEICPLKGMRIQHCSLLEKRGKM
jgi:hypothetical protein